MHYQEYTFVTMLLAITAHGVQLNLPNVHPDAGLTTEEHVNKYGYPLETHFVTTQDGYILAAHRIPHGSVSSNSKRQVVLLMPGLLRSSEVWVNFGPKNSLGFLLADHGFDVWIGNYRGSTWSRRHVRLDPDVLGGLFWDFSMDELGYYDCPAFIDYILNATNQTSLIYIGETVGATMFFTMATQKPSYTNKVYLMIAFAPLIDVGDAQTWIYPTFATLHHKIKLFTEHWSNYEVLKRPQLLSLAIFACSQIFVRDICEAVHYLGVGYNPSQLNKTTLPLTLNGFPSGTSLKLLFHTAQVYQRGVFAKYDNGKYQNFLKYGEVEPPLYSFGNVKTPILYYYGENDAIVEKSGAERFAATLQNVVVKKLLKGFNNGDFLWAIDVVQLLYNDIIAIMKIYSQ